MAVFAGHGIPRRWGVSLLLTEGAGPLFRKHPAGTLREAAFRAAFQLEAG